jgi:hypothetical protein
MPAIGIDACHREMCGLALVSLTFRVSQAVASPSPRRRRSHPRSRRWLIAAFVIAVLAVLVVVSPALLNEPVRRRIGRR